VDPTGAEVVEGLARVLGPRRIGRGAWRHAGARTGPRQRELPSLVRGGARGLRLRRRLRDDRPEGPGRLRALGRCAEDRLALALRVRRVARRPALSARPQPGRATARGVGLRRAREARARRARRRDRRQARGGGPQPRLAWALGRATHADHASGAQPARARWAQVDRPRVDGRGHALLRPRGADLPRDARSRDRAEGPREALPPLGVPRRRARPYRERPRRSAELR
jgi:hypothetical protein